MRRGDIVILADRQGGDFGGKPRPAVIVQADAFGGTDSLAVCLITSTLGAAPLLRVPVEPGERSGLRTPSEIALDKLTSVRRSRVTGTIGRISDAEGVAMNRVLAVFLGFG